MNSPPEDQVPLEVPMEGDAVRTTTSWRVVELETPGKMSTISAIIIDESSAAESEQSPYTLSFRDTLLQREEQVKWRCCPHGITKHSIPLLLAFVALGFTGVGSWDCSYFTGATTGFTGSRYGLWTLENINENCQLWDVLFFSYSLGGYLQAARALSMTAMVLGLSLLTAMSQALQCHFVSWGVLVTLFALFITSVSTTSQYNLWTVFFLFLYVILVLIVRSLFIHPLHRVISRRGSRYIAFLLFVCFVCDTLTLLVLKSDFCQCENLTTEQLEYRGNGSLCEQRCTLATAGILMVIGAGMWLLSCLAVLWVGVQPAWYMGDPSTRRFADYTRDSITTKAKKVTRELIVDAPKMAVGAAKLRLSPVGADKDEGNPKLQLFSSAAGTRNDEENAARSSAKNGEEAVEGCASPGAKNTVIVMDEGSENAASTKNAEEPVEGWASDDVQPQELSRIHSALRPNRTRCQKFCCDFYVKERSRKESILFWCFRICLGALVAIFILIVVMLCGSRYEKLQAERAPSTTPNFVTNVTCAYDANNVNSPFETFQTPDAALVANLTIAHCGGCSHCSNIHDICTYVETRNTITKEAKKCGKVAVLGTTEELHTCLEERIDFSHDCRSCWVENMKCDAKLCIFTCMKTLFTGFLTRNNVPNSGDEGRLNWCLQCDEKMCGTQFAECSGVARRRLGIRSAIERNSKEICPFIETQWDEKCPNSGTERRRAMKTHYMVAFMLLLML